MIISEAMNILLETEEERMTDEEDNYPDAIKSDEEQDVPEEDREYIVLKKAAKKGNHICLHGGDNWKEDSYVAACGVSDMPLMQCLKEHPRITKVSLCLDNDEKGLQFDRIIADRLKEQGYDCEILIPTCKDWNEDLITSEGEEECNLSM